MADENTLRRLSVLTGAIYELSAVGCCLHIVLDDGNWKREHVQWCLDHAEHGVCKEVAELLLKLSDEERQARVRGIFLDFNSPLEAIV